MAWIIKFSKIGAKNFSKLDNPIKKKSITSSEKKLRHLSIPKSSEGRYGITLSGKWRWRVGACRIIALILEEEIIVLVLSIEHCSKVYGGALKKTMHVE